MNQKDATTAAALLRVLEGPQRGARLVLQARRYLFGSGDDCDVVLSDDGVGQEHAEVEVDLAQIALSARDGDVVLIDRIIASGERAEVPLPCVLMMGGTAVGIGAGDTDWTQIPLPDRGALEAAAAEAAAEAAAAEKAAAEKAAAETATAEADETEGEAVAKAAPDTTDDTPAGDALPDDQPAPQTEKVAAAEKPAEESRGRKRGLVVAVSILAIIAAGAGIYGLWGGSSATTGDGSAQGAGASINAEMSQSDVASLVSELGFTEVFVAPGSGGGVTLTGFVEDAPAHLTLISALEERGVSFEDDTRRVDHLLSSVNIALSSFSWPVEDYPTHLRVRYTGSGSIEIDGFLGPQVNRDALHRLIKSDAPGLNIVRFKRATLGEWKAILDSRLAEAGLDKWLETKLNAARIRISGELTPAEAQIWRKAGEAFVAESRGWPQLEIAVTLSAGAANAPVQVEQPAPPPPAPVETAPEPVEAPAEVVARPDVRVIGVILGSEGDARALFSDGESVRVGDIIEDGAEVISIQQHRVVLRFKGKEFIYHMRDDQ